MAPKNKIVNSPPKTSKGLKTDWNKLWLSAKRTFEIAGMDRQKAILENFGGQKEEICRVLNIVSEADLVRVKNQIEKSTEGK